jgi:hypothetical protein
MWRIYQQFWQHDRSTKAHYFVSKWLPYGNRLTLCGRTVAGDYVDSQEPRADLPERTYCKRCRTLLAKQQAA